MTKLEPSELSALPYINGIKPIVPDGYIELGTVTKDEISFSCEDLVKSLPHHYDYKKRVYVDYCNNDAFQKSLKKHYSFDNSYESFLSLLKANEVYLENPLGEEPIFNTEYEFDSDKRQDFLLEIDNWQTAQSKTNTKYLIVKRHGE